MHDDTVFAFHMKKMKEDETRESLSSRYCHHRKHLLEHEDQVNYFGLASFKRSNVRAEKFLRLCYKNIPTWRCFVNSASLIYVNLLKRKVKADGQKMTAKSNFECTNWNFTIVCRRSWAWMQTKGEIHYADCFLPTYTLSMSIRVFIYLLNHNENEKWGWPHCVVQIRN